MNESLITTLRWVGWFKDQRRRKWQPLAEADDYGQCLDLLMSNAPADRLHAEYIVSPRGRDPRRSRHP